MSHMQAAKFAVLEVLIAAEGCVVSAEELLKRAWDENADPFTNFVAAPNTYVPPTQVWA